MATFNQAALWSRVIEKDVYGLPVAPVRAPVMVAVISFDVKMRPTPPRAVLSASRSRFDETAGDVVLLFPPAFDVQRDDTVELFGARLLVDAVWPRTDARGRLDHKQVTLHRDGDVIQNA